MKRNKKIIIFAMSYIFLLCISSCDDNGDGEDNSTTTTPTINTTTTEPITTTTINSIYSLNLSGVTTRQHMQDWDPNWISEVEDYYVYEFQVDPENGGQVGVWGGYGNPPDSGAYAVCNQFIAAGPPAGMPVRVRIKFEYRNGGTWATCSNKTDDPNLGRAHYEVALEYGILRIYKYWGPGLTGTVDATIALKDSYYPPDGTIYWIYLTERRAENKLNSAITITGELLDENLNLLETVSVIDNGNLPGLPPDGLPIIPGSNRRGFGSYSVTNGTGAKILEWYVEAAPD